MNVYIGVDSEGEACVVREKHPVHIYGPWQAEFIRTQATREADAAARAAREAGAGRILVHDLGFIRGVSPAGVTLRYDELSPGVEIALGGVPIPRAVDDTFKAGILLGHHARAGTVGGVLAHTFSSASIERVRLNGRDIGEIAMEALWLGTFGIPVVMVSGDAAACREAVEWLGPVEVAPTKKGFSTHSAISLHPHDACSLIAAKVKAALKRPGKFSPLVIPAPYELRVDCYTRRQAEERARGRKVRLIGTKSYLIRTNDPLQVVP